jgi:MYXO-CTERM domain-containing protein
MTGDDLDGKPRLIDWNGDGYAEIDRGAYELDLISPTRDAGIADSSSRNSDADSGVLGSDANIEHAASGSLREAEALGCSCSAAPKPRRSWLEVALYVLLLAVLVVRLQPTVAVQCVVASHVAIDRTDRA